MTVTHLLALPLLLSLAARPAASIHADEFGRHEWVRRLAGTPDFACATTGAAGASADVNGNGNGNSNGNGNFNGTGKKSGSRSQQALLVSSGTGCVSRVRAGERAPGAEPSPREDTYLRWRTCMPDGATGAAAVVHATVGKKGGGEDTVPAAIGVVSAGGRVLRVLDARTGGAMWDDILHSATEGPASGAAILATTEGDAFVTAAPGRIQRREARTGRIEWSTDISATASAEGNPWTWSTLFETPTGAVVAVGGSLETVSVVEVDLRSGSVIGRADAARTSTVFSPAGDAETPSGPRATATTPCALGAALLSGGTRVAVFGASQGCSARDGSAVPQVYQLSGGDEKGAKAKKNGAAAKLARDTKAGKALSSGARGPFALPGGNHGSVGFLVCPLTREALDISADGGSVVVLHTAPEGSALACGSAFTRNAKVVCYESGESQGTLVTAGAASGSSSKGKGSSNASGGVVTSAFPSLASNGDPVAVFPTADGTRAIVVSTDGSVGSVGGGRGWIREESLATVADSLLIDLPFDNATGDDAKVTVPGPLDFAAGVANTARSAANGFLSLFGMGPIGSGSSSSSSSPFGGGDVSAGLGDADASSGYETGRAVDRETVLTRDRFGTRKLLVALTRHGKVFGVHVETGRVLWSLATGDSGVNRVLMTRSSTHHAHECVALSVGSPTGSAHWFDPLTGKVTRRVELTVPVSHGFVAGVVLEGSRRPLVVVQGNEVKVLPSDDAEGIALVDDIVAKGDLTYWLLDKQTGVMEGFTVLPRTTAGHKGGKGSFPTELRWSLTVLPEADKGKVVAVSSTDSQANGPSDAASPRVRVLGDLTVLMRYENPGLVAIATETMGSTSHGDSVSRVETSTVTLTLVDPASGAILRRLAHPDASGPVLLTRSGNWLTMTYWSVRHSRNEIASIELYTTLPEKYHPLRSGSRVPSLDEVAKRPALLLRHSSHSFILPVTPVATGVTVTSRGIALRDLLVVTANGEVMGINQRLLDPRRPVKEGAALDGRPVTGDTPGAALTTRVRHGALQGVTLVSGGSAGRAPAPEEGLSPYTANLPANPLTYLTRNLTLGIGGRRGIETVPSVRPSTSSSQSHGSPLVSVVSAPTALESTAVVVALGVDHYAAHTQPSKGFDRLGDNFDYGLLFGAMGALAVATAAAGAMVARNKKNKAWL